MAFQGGRRPWQEAAASVERFGGRTPFVGRERELAALGAYLDAAAAGQGAIVLVGGEPGIGKTRTAEELSGRALEHGMRVLWGRCWEGAGAPAFWPWVEALRTLVRSGDAAALREALRQGAADLAVLLPELREQLGAPPDLPALPALEPDQARFRLFESVSAFLRTLAARQPLLLVLDDLHSADAPSLLLLQFLARDLTSAPLLVLGTYRDVEVDRAHPLSETLAALRRQPAFAHIPLRGLPIDAVLAVLRNLAPAGSESAFAHALYDETEGNPFFIQEVLRHLSESGRAAVDAASLRTIGVPDGVREVIGRRVARLSPACIRALTMSAVIGRQFSAGVLRAALAAGETALDDRALAEALDEAEATRIIAAVPDAPGSYRFAHALLRETLYEELTSMRRIRLHREAGLALEAWYAADMEPHLAELAHHFVHAAAGGEVERAITYATLAAERSGRLLAYEEAARQYVLALQSLDLQERGPTPRRCDFLLALGEAEARAGRTAQARERFAQAADLARTLQTPERLARAALGFGGPVVTVGEVDAPLVRLLDEALSALGDEPSALRARVLGRLAMELLYSEETDRRRNLSAEAVAMARRSGDVAALGFALNARHYAIWEPATLPERLTAATEIVQLGETSGNPDLAMQGRRWRIPDLLEAARRNEADAEIENLAHLAEDARQPLYRWYAAVFRAAQALLDGRFAEAGALIDAAHAAGERTHSGTALIYERGQRMVLLRELDRLGELEPWLRGALAPTLPVLRCFLAWLCADSGRPGEARDHLRLLSADGFRAVRRDLTWLASAALLAELCLMLNEPDRAGVLYAQMLPYADWNVMVGIPVYLGSVSRYLGLLATVQRRWSVAERHFQRALLVNERLGAHGWLAHTRHEYAQMLLARADPHDAERARALLAEARTLARTLGMSRLVHKLGDACETAEDAARATRGLGHAASGLTPREIEVLRRIAAGRTTREIAGELVVSVPTVERHITNLYAKIGARGRADATAFALREGIAGRG